MVKRLDQSYKWPVGMGEKVLSLINNQVNSNENHVGILLPTPHVGRKYDMNVTIARMPEREVQCYHYWWDHKLKLLV